MLWNTISSLIFFNNYLLNKSSNKRTGLKYGQILKTCYVVWNILLIKLKQNKWKHQQSSSVGLKEIIVVSGFRDSCPSAEETANVRKQRTSVGHVVFPDLSLVRKRKETSNWPNWRLHETPCRYKLVVPHQQSQSLVVTQSKTNSVFCSDAYPGSISPLPTSGNWDSLGNINQVFKWNLKDMPSVSFD